jgi:hypothetical protein
MHIIGRCIAHNLAQGGHGEGGDPGGGGGGGQAGWGVSNFFGGGRVAKVEGYCLVYVPVATGAFMGLLRFVRLVLCRHP